MQVYFLINKLVKSVAINSQSIFGLFDIFCRWNVWLAVWLTVWLGVWLTEWLAVGLAVWFVGRLAEWLAV